jgi:diguanylate cyclase (GGDEF)-like protein
MALASRGKRVFVLAMLDMDDFKVVNDTRGHLAGDALLIELAQTWQAQLRRSDVLSRFGGDEFALLMPGTTRQQGEHLLARIRAAHPASWSAGTVEWNGDDSFEQMLRRADRNLYEAKATRGRVLAAHHRDEQARPVGARARQRANDGGGEDVGATATTQQPGNRQARSQAAM